MYYQFSTYSYSYIRKVVSKKDLNWKQLPSAIFESRLLFGQVDSVVQEAHVAEELNSHVPR